MNEKVKNMIRQLIPASVLRLVRPGGAVVWSGNYPDWKSAREASTGYEADQILQKVTAASLKVKNGAAAFERDSVLFYETQYSWPLLAALMAIAAHYEGKLRIMDFGGSLGSTYYQYLKLLNQIKEVKWCVVEQEGFYETGKKMFEDDRLKFYQDAEDCLVQNKIDVVLLGCVLPYIELPFSLLEKIGSFNVSYLILDRMPFIDADRDRLTVQRVSEEIYEGSYPAWFFSYSLFKKFITNKYEVMAEYPCEDRANIASRYTGLILKLK